MDTNIGRDQFIINDPTGKISIGPTDVVRVITVSGVGGTPPNFEDYWVDRLVYQESLSDRIEAHPVTEIVALGGFGKSSLAAWFYEMRRSEFQKRVWVGFGQPKSFDRVARWILQEIGFPNRDPEVNEAGLLQELVYRLNEPNVPVKALVVLDQLEAIADAPDRPWFDQFLTQWAAQGKLSRVLVTTRSQILSREPIVLGGLTEAEGVVFFDREGLTGNRFAELIELAGGHPLLLKLATTWTQQTYGGRVDDRALDFFGKLFGQYQGDPAAKVEQIFAEILKTLPKGWVPLLLGLSVYRLSFDGAMAGALVPQVEAEQVEQVLAGLLGKGLLLAEGERFSLHPLVKELVVARVPQQLQQQAHERAIAYYSENFQPWDRTIESCQEELEGFYHCCELGQYGRAYGLLSGCVKQLELAGCWRDLVPLYARLTAEWQSEEDEETKNLGRAWTRLGNLQRELGEVSLSIDTHHQAQALFDRLDFAEGKAAALCNLGNAYYSLGDYQRAIDFYSQHREMTQAIGDKGGIANSLCGLGNAYQSIGDYQRAIEFHFQYRELAQAIDDKRGVANSLSGLGNAYYSLNDYQRAIEFQSQSLEMAQAIGDRNGEARSFFNLAQAQAQLDDHWAAKQNLEQAKAVYTALKLDHMVEKCDQAIRERNRIIAATPRMAPLIEEPEALPDWWTKSLPFNESKPRPAANNPKLSPWLWATAGLSLSLLIVIAYLRR